MDILLEHKMLRRKLCGIAAMIALVLFTACFVFARLEVIVTSDILLANSFIAKLLSLLQTLLIVLGFALFYSFTAFLLSKVEFIGTLSFIFVVIGITLFRSLLSLGGKYFIDGISSYDFFLYVLPTQAISFGLELAQYFLVLLITWLCLRYFPKESEKFHAHPLQKRFGIPHALLRSLFFIALTVMILNIGSRILYDIDYGAPTSTAEACQMLLAYTSDILIYGMLLFFVMCLLTTWANTIYQKLKGL